MPYLIDKIHNAYVAEAVTTFSQSYDRIKWMRWGKGAAAPPSEKRGPPELDQFLFVLTMSSWNLVVVPKRHFMILLNEYFKLHQHYYLDIKGQKHTFKDQEDRGHISLDTAVDLSTLSAVP